LLFAKVNPRFGSGGFTNNNKAGIRIQDKTPGLADQRVVVNDDESNLLHRF
jgi:hypothetical protein